MKKQIQIIQIIRLFSALIVFLSHFFARGEYSLPNQVGFVGRTGVAFFFMISGFLLIYTDRGTTKGYFRKRIIRLVPLYWISTFLVYGIGLLYPSFLHTASATPEALIKSLCFIPFYLEDMMVLPLYPIAWTLTAEVFVYIVYYIPLLLLKIPALAGRVKGKEVYFKGIMTSCILVLIVAAKSFVPRNLFTDAYGANYMLYFVTGILFATFWGKLAKLQEKLAIKPSSAKLPLAFGIGVFLLIISVFYEETYLSIILIAVVFLALLVLFWEFEFPVFLIRGGDVSYSFYLIHYFVVKAFLRIVIRSDTVTNLPAGILLCLICYAITMGLSLVSFELLEKKTSSVLKKCLKLS